MLNSRTGHIGQWHVAVCNANIINYEYMWQGKARQNSTFQCMLVSVKNPQDYCIGEVRMAKKNKDPLDKAAEKF